MPDGANEEKFLCSAADCARPIKARGMCTMHYTRWYKANPGQVTRYGPRGENPFERVKRLIVVNSETGCWEKLGWVNNAGYGQVRVGQKFFLMHRLAYEGVHGPIPAGMVIDHLCRNRRCSNPDHLEAVTQKENLLRAPTTLVAKWAARKAS